MDKKSSVNRLTGADWAMIILMVIAVAYACIKRTTGWPAMVGLYEKYSSLPMMIYLVVGICIVACKHEEGPLKAKDFILLFAYPIVFIFLFSMA